jgi:fatty acid desaturase
MTAIEVLRRLRRFLLLVTVLLFGGALTELWLVRHTQEAIQWLAFAFAILGAFAALLVLFRESRATLLIFRVCMVVVALGSLFGIYEHVTGNVAFQREIRPDSSTAQLISSGLRGGNPLLAPGVLAVAAILGLSATYRQGVTRDEENSSESH